MAKKNGKRRSKLQRITSENEKGETGVAPEVNVSIVDEENTAGTFLEVSADLPIGEKSSKTRDTSRLSVKSDNSGLSKASKVSKGSKVSKDSKGAKHSKVSEVSQTYADILMSPAAFSNLYFIAHDAAHVLSIRGFQCPHLPKSKKKGKK